MDQKTPDAVKLERKLVQLVTARKLNALKTE